jgi:tetratricopeptide (TPR) repeat protein
LENAIEDYKKGEVLRPDESRIAIALTRCFILKGDFESAEVLMRPLLEEHPRSYEVNLLVGAIAERNGDLSRAETTYLAARKDGSQSAYLTSRLGFVYCRQKRYEKAIPHLEEALRLGCDSDAVLYYLGLANARCAKYGIALENWEALAQKHPEDQRLTLNIHRLHYLLGCDYVKEQKYEEAAAAWKVYVTPRLEDGNLRKEFSEVHFRAGMKQLIT